MKPWVCIGAVLAMLIGGPLVAQQQDCYELAQTGDGSQQLDELVITGDGGITFTYAGLPHIPYEDDCDITGVDEATCPLDCDGGHITLIRLPEGLLASFSRRIESVRFESTATAAGAGEAEGQSLVGTYMLRPAPDAVCREIATRKIDVALGAGAHFPGIEQLETGLAKAGYFAGVPDWTFTPETADALRTAQADLGQPVTGTADRAFLRLLATYITKATGGC